MYFYNLSGYEENSIIQHEHKFTKEQFQMMCKEAPLGGLGERKYYDSMNIIEYLKKKYNFKELKTTAGFFVDNEVK